MLAKHEHAKVECPSCDGTHCERCNDTGLVAPYCEVCGETGNGDCCTCPGCGERGQCASSCQERGPSDPFGLERDSDRGDYLRDRMKDDGF